MLTGLDTASRNSNFFSSTNIRTKKQKVIKENEHLDPTHTNMYFVPYSLCSCISVPSSCFLSVLFSLSLPHSHSLVHSHCLAPSPVIDSCCWDLIHALLVPSHSVIKGIIHQGSSEIYINREGTALLNCTDEKRSDLNPVGLFYAQCDNKGTKMELLGQLVCDERNIFFYLTFFFHWGQTLRTDKNISQN